MTYCPARSRMACLTFDLFERLKSLRLPHHILYCEYETGYDTFGFDYFFYKQNTLVSVQVNDLTIGKANGIREAAAIECKRRKKKKFHTMAISRLSFILSNIPPPPPEYSPIEDQIDIFTLFSDFNTDLREKIFLRYRFLGHSTVPKPCDSGRCLTWTNCGVLGKKQITSPSRTWFGQLMKYGYRNKQITKLQSRSYNSRGRFDCGFLLGEKPNIADR